MNAPPPPSPILSGDEIARARRTAAVSGRSVHAELEALCGLEPRGLVAALAATLGTPVIETADIAVRAGIHNPTGYLSDRMGRGQRKRQQEEGKQFGDTHGSLLENAGAVPAGDEASPST